MPYTPPPGNAVDFNFTGSVYHRPPGNSIIFNFGAIPGPPFLDDQLPTGKRQAVVYEDDWFWQPRRLFAPLQQSIIVPIQMRRLDYQVLADEDYWVMPRRQILATPPFGVGRRAILFTVT